MIENIIYFDEESKGVAINREAIELITYPKFKKLLTRDRGSAGDYDGRKKHIFLMELGYIYMLGSPKSFPNASGFSEDDADEYARDMLGIPGTWKPDKLVYECLEIYRKEQLKVDKRIALNLVRVLRNYEVIITKVSDRMNKLLVADDIEIKLMNELLGLNDKLVDMALKVPGDIARLREFISKMKKEDDGSVERGRAGIEITDSMNPDNA